MAVLFDRQTRLLVQGITGREGQMVTAHMLRYGTAVVAGVTPGRSGMAVAGVPVFDTVAEAVAATQPNATLISVPPLAVLDAVLEALTHGLRLLVVATERVPLHDAAQMLAAAREAGATLIGPNSVGVICPGERVKVGAIGGEYPERVFVPGSIGIISRSGGMTAELALMVKRAGFGVSTAVSVGGDACIGMPPAALLPQFMADPETTAIVLFGEPGTQFEEDVAAWYATVRPPKPVFALIAGRFTEQLPEGTPFGHAAAVIRAAQGRPSAKIAALRAVGVWAGDQLAELTEFLAHLRRPLLQLTEAEHA